MSIHVIVLRLPKRIATNNYFPKNTNFTWWNLKSTKFYCGYIRKSLVIHNMYYPEGSYFWREESKFQFSGENSPKSIPVINKMTFWQLMHLSTWWTILQPYIFSKNHLKMWGKSNISIISFEVTDKYILKSLISSSVS